MYFKEFFDFGSFQCTRIGLKSTSRVQCLVQIRNDRKGFLSSFHLERFSFFTQTMKKWTCFNAQKSFCHTCVPIKIKDPIVSYSYKIFYRYPIQIHFIEPILYHQNEGHLESVLHGINMPFIIKTAIQSIIQLEWVSDNSKSPTFGCFSDLAAQVVTLLCQLTLPEHKHTGTKKT